MSEKDENKIIDILLIKLFKGKRLGLYERIDFPQSVSYKFLIYGIDNTDLYSKVTFSPVLTWLSLEN